MSIASITPRPAHLLPAALLCSALLVGCGSDDDDSSPTAPGGGDTTEWLALAAIHDTYLDDDNANTNYGQSGVLRVGPDRNALLQFDLQALSADAVITGLRLRLTQSADNGAATAASVRVTWLPSDSWTEDEATADEHPNLGSEVLGDFPLDALASGHQPVTVTTAEALAKGQVEQFYNNRILGLRLSSNQQVEFLSAEYPEATARPSLEVTYADGTRVVAVAQEDAFVLTGTPNANTNDLDYVQVDRNVAYTYLKFDLAAVPADAQLAYASVKMLASDGYAYGGDGNVYSFLVPDDTWSAATITAGNAPAPTGEHLGFWWLWYDGTDRDAWGATRSERMVAAAQGEVAGDRVLSLRLNSPGYYTKYYRTTDPDPAKRPVLELVYTR